MVGLVDIVEKIKEGKYVLRVRDVVEGEEVDINMRLLTTEEVVKLVGFAQQIEKGSTTALENLIKHITRIVLSVNPYPVEVLKDKMSQAEYEKAMEIFIRRNFDQIMEDIAKRNFPQKDVPDEIKELMEKRGK